MDPAPEPDPRYDDVRRKLSELGYLDGRIGRFVLRDLGSEGSSVARVARTAVKAAALGAPILGGLLAGAVIASNRPLLRTIDGLLLWLYCTAVAGAGLFALDVLAGSATIALARRRGVRSGDMLRSSLLVAIPTLGYLLVLWWRRLPGSGIRGDIGFLAAAAGATLFVAWLGGLVSLAGIIGRTGIVPDRARRSVLSFGGIVLLLVAAGLAARAAGGRGEAEGAPASAFQPAAAPRLLLIGIDGLDGDLVESLAPEGHVAELLAWLRAGALFPLRRMPGPEPAQVWTTIVTGAKAEVHGIRAADAERVVGVTTPLGPTGSSPLAQALRFLLPTRTVPASGIARRVLSLWEIVGLRSATASIGWWASWPARDGERGPPGYVVSDRVLAKLLAGRGDDRDTAPASLFERLAAQFETDRAALRGEFDARFSAIDDREVARLTWESFLIDGWHLRTAGLLLQDPAVRAAFVYLPGLEILRHRLSATGGPAGGTAAGRAVSVYADWVTGSLGLAARREAGETVVLVADPGRAAGPRSEGFVSVIGSSARPGCIGAPISDLDVTPLLLDLLGFPASDELAGRVPGGPCLDRADPPRGSIATYGRKPLPKALSTRDDDLELLDRLRSLGYVR